MIVRYGSSSDIHSLWLEFVRFCLAPPLPRRGRYVVLLTANVDVMLVLSDHAKELFVMSSTT